MIYLLISIYIISFLWGAIRKGTRHEFNAFAPDHLNTMLDFGIKFKEKIKFLSNCGK